MSGRKAKSKGKQQNTLVGKGKNGLASKRDLLASLAKVFGIEVEFNRFRSTEAAREDARLRIVDRLCFKS